MEKFSYIGSELEIFNHATKWKNYYANHLRNFLGKEVLEVGAGIGGTTKILCSNHQTRWVCLEPDQTLLSQIEKQISEGILPACCEAKAANSAEIETSELFDSIIYIDVLEHIENDKGELSTISKHLKKNGHLIILSPAHQGLFTPFDTAIGHYRRYNKETLAALVPSHLKQIKLIYLDSLGLMLSLGNKLILNSSLPTHEQIQFWDKVIVPISKFIDPILRFSIGKSVLGIWKNV
jgi:SAM-dependent methyltransferase